MLLYKQHQFYPGQLRCCVWVDVSVYTMVRVPGSHVYINTELITIRVTCLITIRVTCHDVTSQESPINAP